MYKKKMNIFDIILNTILFLLSILVIYWALQLIFGGSPELIDFISAIIILIAGFLFNVYREVGEIKVGLKHSFINIKEDMNSIKEDLNLIKKKLYV
jgi:hypothetical protein